MYTTNAANIATIVIVCERNTGTSTHARFLCVCACICVCTLSYARTATHPPRVTAIIIIITHNNYHNCAHNHRCRRRRRHKPTSQPTNQPPPPHKHICLPAYAHTVLASQLVILQKCIYIHKVYLYDGNICMSTQRANQQHTGTGTSETSTFIIYKNKGT